jgi:probable LLM family oxidoreductase
MPIEIGVDSFAAMMPDMATGRLPTEAERMAQLLAEAETAERAGLDAFGVGEHHRGDFIDSSPAVILAAAAGRTRRIRLHSAVTVLSAADPVRAFQDYATLDLVSGGRAEMVVGRGSFIDAFPLFGLKLEDYDDLFTEKLGLLLKLREAAEVTWSGRFRPALDRQAVHPRPMQSPMPLWIGVGGTPDSFIRAGTLGLPLMVAIIGGTFDRFRPLVDLYREAGRRAGHPAESLRVGLHAFGFVAETDAEARDVLFKGWHHMFTRLARERGWSGASRAQFDAMCAPGGAFLVGSPATVAAKLAETNMALGGLARVNFQMSAAAGNHEAMKRSITLLGEEVAPAMRKATGAG